MASWSTGDLIGPDGEDWRVPVTELESRLNNLSNKLTDAGISGALLQNPVDLYYYAGGRQNGALFVPSSDSNANIEQGGNGPIFYVRRSVSRAKYESGDNDSPLEVEKFPSLRTFAETLSKQGLEGAPALQFGEIPADFCDKFRSVLSPLGQATDCTHLIHQQREVKSNWELDMMREGAVIQQQMFDAVEQSITIGATELDIVAAAEAVSRRCGFGGNVQMRRFPLQCDRAVIVSGRAGGVPSFFDSAIGGVGPHPLAGMGSGFNKLQTSQPILVDLVHVHRGYVVDATRMFSIGQLPEPWESRLWDMVEVSDTVVQSLGRGEDCSKAWQKGAELAGNMGHSEHLMGMKPDQSQFLGHSVGLQLDESPVVARGFDRPLVDSGVMAIEPKLVYSDGSIGLEDTWVKTAEGMERVTLVGNNQWLNHC
tara:strand:- start:5225 stop:6499 length:1275 start_codon:yes stop_codon:yes gene_type:complete